MINVNEKSLEFPTKGAVVRENYVPMSIGVFKKGTQEFSEFYNLKFRHPDREESFIFFGLKVNGISSIKIGKPSSTLVIRKGNENDKENFKFIEVDVVDTELGDKGVSRLYVMKFRKEGSNPYSELHISITGDEFEKLNIKYGEKIEVALFI